MAQKLWTVDNATFNIIDINVVAMSMSDGSPPQTFFSDGDIYSQFAWMENVVPTAIIQTQDLTHADGFAPGQQAALIQEWSQRATGIGGLDTPTLTATWVATTMLGTINPSATQAGESALSLPFTGISADGTTTPVATAIA